MKVTNTHYRSIDELAKKLDLFGLDTRKTLVQVFSGLVSENEVQQIQTIIKNNNPEVAFIGTTTAGEIFEGDIYENSITISVMEFKDTIVFEKYFNNDNDFETGKEIAASLVVENTQALILFIDGLQTNANDVVDGISSLKSSVPIAGGLAGDSGAIEHTFVFDSDGVYEKGSVVASLQSDKLHIYTQYQLNWQAIGKTMKVTKAEKNRLYEIDGINASEIYKKYLGEKIGENLPFSATEFPLLKIEDDGSEICRTITQRFEDGSLLTVGNLEVGDKVRLAFGNVDLILNDTKKSMEKFGSCHPEGIFIYSCAARKAFLQSEIVSEIKPFNKIAPNIGFFTFGEIYHQDNKNALLSMSLSVLALSEQEESRNDSKKIVTDLKKDNEHNFMANKHYLALEALAHLSNTVIGELEAMQQQLKEQANRDYLTGLYNRRYFNEIAQELIHISKREKKAFSVIMLDIDKFKKINDTYGHIIGDDVIKTLADTIIQSSRKSDTVSRYGGEEFALLLPFTDKEGAFRFAEKLRKNVENKKIVTNNAESIRFTISLGVACILDTDTNIEESLDRADSALYQAKESGRNKVILASSG